MKNRIAGTVGCILLVWMAFAAAAFGQVNDLCSGAIALTSGVTNTANTLNATSTGDPLPACEGNFGRGVWYTVTTPGYNVRVDLSTCGSSFTTVMEVYTGTCGALTNFLCADYNSSPFCGGEAGVSFSAASNTTYYVLVGGYGGAGGNLQIVADIVAPPGNDTCAGAVALANGVTNTVNTFNATEFGDPVPSCEGNFGRGVWYTVTTPGYNVRVDLSTCGSSFTTVMEVYTGTCGALTNFLCADYNSSPFCGGEAGVSFSAASNTTYYVLVGGYGGAGGNLQIVADIVAPPGNDTCAGAVALANGVTNTVNTFNATEFGDPVPSCEGNFGRGVWYTVTTPGYNVRVDLSTCGSSFTTVMEVYTGTCGALTNFLCADYNSSPFCGGEAGVSFSAASNTTYYVLVGGYGGAGGNLQIVADIVAPPGNDTCAGAVALANGVTNTVNTFNATEFGDPVPSCEGNFGRGVWYTVTTPGYNVRVDLSTCGSSFTTVMEVYTGTCGALTNFLCADYNSSPFCGGEAGVSFSAASNTTYYVLVGGYGGAGGNLQIVADIVAPPGNDTCAGAVALANGVTNTVNTFNATEFGDPVPSCEGNFGRGVWYTVTTPGYNVRVDLSTCGSSFTTVMEVYTGTCGALTNFLCADYNSSPFCGGEAGVSFSAASNTTYYVLVGGYGGAGGNLQIVADIVAPPGNDTCAGAVALANGVTNTVNTFNATEFGDPVPSCEGNFGRGVWYTVTTPGYNVRVDLSTCGSSFTTVMEVYTGTCGALTNFLCADYNSSPFCGGEAGVSFSAASNTTYYVLVGGYGGAGGNLQIVADIVAPPGNDTCAGAVALANGVTNTVNTFNATEFGDPVPSCEGNFGRGVWYTVTTPGYNVRVDLSTCGSSFTTVMEVYTGTCGALTNFLCADYNSSPFCGGEAGVSFSAASNTTYYVLVGGYGGAGGNLQIVADIVAPPGNDTCAGAVALANGVTNTVNTFNATEFGDPVPSCEGNFGRGVWYTVTTATNGPVTISTCGSSFATVMEVYTGTCGALTNFLCADQNSPYCNYEAGVSFNGTSNTTYYILVGGYGGVGGNLQIVATTLPPPNDACAGAIGMTPSVTYHVNTVSATSTGDPTPSCQNSFGNGVWYNITPAITERLDVSTCGSDFGTVMAIYTGTCGALTPFLCSDRTSPTCPNEADLNFIATGGVTYQILVGGIGGSSGNLQIAANVVLPPIISNIFPNIGLTNGGTVVNLSGTGFESGATVSFGSLSAVSVTVTGGTNISAVTPPSAAGPVNVVVGNPDGDIATVTNGFTFIAPPVIQIQPFSQSVVVGSNVQFQIQVGGSSPFTYQWYFNAGGLTDNARITGSQSNILSIANVQTGDAGSYQVVVSNVYGTTSSIPAVLTVLIPPSISTQPQSRTNLGGTTATFNVTASGTTPLSYQWLKSGAAISGATGPSLSLTDVQLSDAAAYKVVITNVAGSVTSQPGMLSVVAPSLRATNVTVPLQAWTGEAFNVSWTDTNAGTATATGPWVDNVYLSPSLEFQVNISQLLGSFQFTSNLVAGQSIERIQTVTINRNGITNGQWYVVVVADANGNVPGDSEPNNPLGISSNLSVFVTPLPDLAVTSVMVPTNGIGDQPVTVTWTVCNTGQGDTDVPIWYDHLYLSPTTNIADAIEDYGEYANPGYLVPSECYDQSATVNLPVGYGGPYYFIVQGNSTGSLLESSTTNNIGYSIIPINIQEVTTGFLHVQSVQVAPAAPTATWSGQPVTVTWVIQNTGQSVINNYWYDDPTLSPTPTYDFVHGYFEVAFERHTGPLAPGASYTNSAQFTVPAEITPGSWYVVLVVDPGYVAEDADFNKADIGRDQNSALIDIVSAPESDLVTVSVTAPSNAVAGQSIQLQWVVANQGVYQTSGNFWYDADYLSTNPVFNITNSTLLGTFGYWGGLALGASYTNTESVTLPTNAIGTNYLFVFSDAGSNVLEVTLSNNVLASPNPLVISSNLPAQLVVSSVAIPNTSVAGRAATISWTVLNSGPGATSTANWVDSVYLITGTNFNLSQAIFLGSVPHTGALNPGGYYIQSQTFNIPACDTGTFTVFVQADSASQVNEAGPPSQNLGSSPASLRVFASPSASLEVYSISVPEAAIAGENVAVTWTVLNTGNDTTNAPWMDAAYISTSPVFDPATAQFLGITAHTNNLPSGGSYFQSQTNPLPACLSGSYYVYITTDVSNTVNALSCQTNNTLRSSAPVQIAPAPYPNLLVVGMALPSTATSGIPWAVQWTVTNTGTGAANPPWSDAIYASTQPNLDSSALFLGFFSYTNNLASGGTYVQTQSVSLPACLAGWSYVYILPDVSNQVDSAACRTGETARSTNLLPVINLPYPDLQVANIGLPATAAAGQPISISWVVTNSGFAAASGPWTDSVYLSATPGFSVANSVFLGAYNYSGTLAVGFSYSQTATPTIPQGLSGTYFLVVVTDSSNQVQECSGEDNNTLVSSGTVQVPITIQPDLIVPSVTAPASAFSGQSITVSWVVENDGTASTGNRIWYDSIYLSQDQILDPTDIRLGSFPRVSNLNVGGSYTNSASVLLPSSSSGPYYIFVVADSGGDLYDGFNEADNIGITPDAMVVTLSAPVDLAASNVTISPASGVPGTTVTVNWTVLNNSINPSSAVWTDGIYISTNNFWDVSAVPLGTQNHQGITGNGSYSSSWTGPLPALTPGNYHVIVWTDVRNTALETNLANNIALSAGTISMDIPIITLGQTVTNELSTGVEQYYKVNVPAGQTVLFSLVSMATNSANELYVRFGAAPDLGNYDYIFSNALAANQQIQVPTTQAGWYYILVRGYDVSSTLATYMLNAQAIPFAITGVTPTNIGDNGQVTITVNGALFLPGELIQLVSGTNIYPAATNLFVNGSQVMARFFFTNAVHGIYNVTLANPNSTITSLSNSLNIETATALEAQVVNGQINLLPRQGAPFNWVGYVTNAGNVDIPYATVSVFVDEPYTAILDSHLSVLPSLTDGDGDTNAFIVRDVAPGTSINFSYDVNNVAGQAFGYEVVSSAQSLDSLLSDEAEIADITRQYLITLTNADNLPPEITMALADQNTWESYCAQSLNSVGLISYPANPLPPLAPQPETVSDRLKIWTLSKLGVSPQQCTSVCVASAVAGDVLDLEGMAQQLTDPTTSLLSKVLHFPKAYYSLLGSMVDNGNGITRCIAVICDNLPGACGQASTLADGNSSGDVCPVSPRDPNTMVGPTGYGGAAFIGVQQPSLYSVYFANETNASAYARQIAITNSFDPGFDIRSFRLGEIAIGNITVIVPPNRAYYQTRVAAPAPNPTNIVVDVTAGIDLANRRAFWTLNAIDLNTGQLVTDASEGVLPPDNTNQIGEGHVIYTILPNTNISTDTIVTNQAVIVFDDNEPIATDTTTNTVDGVAPTSTVASLPIGTVQTNFTVSWFGTDDPNGSDLSDYDVYVSDNGAPYQPWQSATMLTSAVYNGQIGHAYSFYSVAHDNAENTETPASVPEASVYVSGDVPPTLQPVQNQFVNFTSPLLFTNIATDSNGPGLTLTYSLIDAPPGVSIDPTNGVLTWQPSPSQGGTTNLITVSVTDNGVPPLSTSQSFLAVVADYTALSLGNAVVQTGHSGVVPIYFFSSANVTNLAFSFNFDSTRLTNWNVASLIAQATSATVTGLAPSLESANVGFGGSPLFHGTEAVAQLTFQAVSNAHSAFASLAITNVQALNSAGQILQNDLIQNGRIVVVGLEPLLEAGLGSNLNRVLTLYGNPGSSYQVASITNLLETNWVPAWRVPLTNVFETFAVDQTSPQIYYRAWEFFADPPILDLGSFSPTNLMLVMYGRNGSNYSVMAGTNLANASNWLPVVGFTLTNSFRFVDTGATTNAIQFFRAVRP